MNSEKFKKALRIAVNVGCGFEGDAEDAASLLGLITGLESRIAELEEKQRWIPVGERLPEEGQQVLSTDGEEYYLDYYAKWDGKELSFCGTLSWTVTHWMPLPSTPEVQE